MKVGRYAEATPDGIRDGNSLTGYRTAIRKLDAGDSDGDLFTGLRAISLIWEAERLGYFTPTGEQWAETWRWVVAALFIIEQRETYSTIEVKNEQGGTDTATIYAGEHGAIAVYPAAERFSLANHIEGLALEKYGAEAGYPLAVGIYKTMTEAIPGKGLRLSEQGRMALAMLHDGFIEMLNSEGVPDAPVKH
ncbi:hypothetical protein [Pantoea sp. 1.19]|uniref:hypothetical protein n=1 Tax=Pantoea sp. 1.19 TaxID=1925589 RepID=UPI0009F87235|nr:hypothetical protein [Pantoea sp. 1.19]